ncbi:peptidoglycan-binding domain-containing protein [Leptolyngbya sp. FACHB-321]|uniref:peptidoglycan-binding domain-containing protein n=1 Tax=Leptolyngbya sp. FACHB-321 TaxID=2692807 RepID=UPI0018F01F97|nr:peptidoglycan-binding domain-containing protein [Leptolyngbya sp. FACHB-321]
MGSDVRAYAAKTQTINFWLVRRVTLSLLSMSWLTVALVSLTSATALSQLTSSQTTISQTTGATTPEVSGTTLLRSTLKPGSRGSEVTELQAALKLLGYYSGTVDGVYGQSTVSAVSQFQQAAGLNADGITGSATWNRLFPDAVETAGAARIAPTPTAANVSPLPATSGAASFPTPSGVSPAPAKATPAASPRPAANPASGTPAPKPNKPAGTRPAAANTATPSTATPETVALPILRQGMKGSAVVALQERLRSLGVFKGTADGVFGAETLAAVKAAQRRFKLAPDGVVGTGTWGVLLR